MANTYTLIASTTVGSGGASTIDFTSIPSTYTDLLVKVSGRAAATGWTTSTVRLTFNGVGGSSYNRRSLYNTAGGSAGSDNASGAAYIAGIGNQGSSSTSNTFGNIEFYIYNYTGSTNKYVSIDSVTENNGTDIAEQFTAGLFTSSSAISSISLLDVNGNFVQYSTAYLYGIKNS